MRRVDRWLGVAVCFALTRVRRCGDLWRRLRRSQPAAVRRILFVKLAEQGATVLAYPAIQRAAEMVGRENVFFLVFEENRFILDAMDAVPEENVLTIPTIGAGALVGGAIRALWRLRKLGPNAAVDLEFFARSSAALTYLSGAGVRVGLHGFGDKAPYRGDLMTHRLRYDPRLHTSDAFAVMAEAIGVSPAGFPDAAGELPRAGDSAAVFRAGEEELAKVASVVQREAGTADYRPLVLFNANASDLLPLRRWPTERYVELASGLLQRRPETRIAFTGAPDEAAVAEELVERVGSNRCFSMAGKTTLRELLTLYSLADVLVTNDSGPAHFATLTPIHVITLFGPETPALFGARTPRSHVVWKGLACSPCVNAWNNRLSTCRNNECMQAISVEEVLDLAIGVLEMGLSAG